MYIATQSVGRFATGDEVVGLSDERADELIKMGAIVWQESNAKESETAKESEKKPKSKKSKPDDLGDDNV